MIGFSKRTLKHNNRWVFLIGIFIMFLSSGRSYAGQVHALVINGRSLCSSSSKKIYNALTKNKLPIYTTTAGNIHYFSYDVSSSAKHPTNEAFYSALDTAFGSSTKDDLNILYYAGHGAENGIPTWMKGSESEAGILYTDLAAYLNNFKGKFVVISNTCCARAFYTSGVQSLKNGNAKFLCLSSTNQLDVSVGNLYPDRILDGIGYKDFVKSPMDMNHDGLFSADEVKDYTNLKSLIGATYMDGVGPGSGTPIFQLTYLKMNKTSLEINLETQKKATLKVSMKNHAEGVKREVIWESSNENIISLSTNSTTADGTHSVTLTPHKAGTATITAYLNSTLGKCTGTEVTCKVTVSNYKSLYKAFLAKGTTSIKQNNYTSTVKLTSYCLLDIDQNGIPELIVKATNPGQGAAYDYHYIYTVRKGKVKFCGEIVQRGNANVYYNRKYKALQNSGWTNFVGGTWAHLFRLKKGKISQFKYVWEGYSDTNNTKYVYYTGNSDTKRKKVSKAKYTKFVKKYFGKKRIREYKFKLNNVSNRKKSFG